MGLEAEVVSGCRNGGNGTKGTLKLQMSRRLCFFILLLVPLLLTTGVQPTYAYSVLTHEQLIDLTWEKSIVPLLLSRYPKLTPGEIEQARAYAYGGCVIQDIGYYPFGDPFFSDLTHYVRSGDFVVNLYRYAQSANELAFAVGALSHYIGDNIGHSEATNQAVPIEFPKLRAKYGDSVNYAEGEHQHVQTEFAFDINEIAHHRFAPVHYLRHVGLEVPSGQLAKAFYQTYGLGEDFQKERGRRINIRGYRFAVRAFIPRIAYAVTLLHRRHEPADVQDADMQRLDAAVQKIAAENHWDVYRKKPGIGTYSLAGLLYVLPKVGPIKLAAVKGPTPQTEVDYIHSVVQSTDVLNRALRRFTPPPTAASPLAKVVPKEQVLQMPAAVKADLVTTDRLHPLANRDLDTGRVVKPAGYRLTDETYADLLHRLVMQPAGTAVPPGVKAEVLAYYADLSLPFATKRKPQRWAMVQQDLVALGAIAARDEDPVFATYDDAPQ